MLSELINDIDFKLFAAELRKGFFAYIRSQKRLLETDYGKLYTLYYTGRMDTAGEMAALRKFKNVASLSEQREIEDRIVEVFPIIQKFSEKYKESVYVITSIFLAMASAEPEIKEVRSTTEAAEEWEMDSSTIRHAIDDGRFEEYEYRKSGPRLWILTRSAMIRVFGEPKRERQG